MTMDASSLRDEVPVRFEQDPIRQLPNEHNGSAGLQSDWKVVRLGDHARFLHSIALSRAQMDSTSAVGCLHYGDIHTRSNVLFNGIEEAITRASHDLVAKADRLEVGDLVFADASEDEAGVGKSVEILAVLTGGMVAGMHTIAVRFDKTVFADGFKAYLQFIPEFRSALLRLTAGTKVLATTRNYLASIELRLPPIGEQVRTAEALATVDAVIEGLACIILKKRDIKQGLMQALLTGKTRLPGFSGLWPERPIRDFTQVVSGGTPSTGVSEYWGGDIKWMSSGELHQKRVHQVAGRISQLGLENSSARLVPAGSVLIGLAGQGKTRGTAAITSVELATNQSVAAILPSDEHDSDYLYFNMNSRYEELREASTGSGGRGGLNLGIISVMLVSFPSLDEQREIAAVLRDADSEVLALEVQLEKTRLIRQGMMQELLTGRTRLMD